MFDVAAAVLAPGRRRGPKPFFEGERLFELAKFLSEPGSTIAAAAKHFECSESTVEKTLARIRRQAQAKKPRAMPGDSCASQTSAA